MDPTHFRLVSSAYHSPYSSVLDTNTLSSPYSTSHPPPPLPAPQQGPSQGSSSRDVHTQIDLDQLRSMAMLLNNTGNTSMVGSSKTLDQISARLDNPSAFGFPIYSASGFDVLSIMARVATRPNPTLKLGPVDLSCSFLIVDVRRYDSPIVYASPGFIALTGYAEHEVLGRNCRFLQAPDGSVVKGEERRFTSHSSVAQMKKAAVAGKECQTCLINYKKDGTAFMNLVSIIPLPGGVHNTPEEVDQIAYHIGFQIDLSVQPDAILRKLEDGSYVTDNGNQRIFQPSMGALPQLPRDRRLGSMTSPSVIPVSKSLRLLLTNEKFIKSVPFTPTPPNNPSQSVVKSIPSDDDQLLSFTLLGGAPDFIHVLSLRGSFLYVAPSVKRVLGYAAEDLAGKMISDYCHPADLVPLMRELKESSSLPSTDGGPPAVPRKVDLLYRIKSKDGAFVWVESRGRLHVESGKGRKAIILSGRVRPMPKLTWGSPSQTGGLAVAAPGKGDPTTPGNSREFWGTVNPDGTFLFVGASVRDLLGWSVSEVIGQRLEDFVVSSKDQRQPEYNTYKMISESLVTAVQAKSAGPTQLAFEMRKKDGSKIRVLMVLYHTTIPRSTSNLPDPLICQVKMANDSVYAQVVRPSQEQVFEEMEVSRKTSWQYELQQLRYANERLLEEVQNLEAVPSNRPIAGTTHGLTGNGLMSAATLYHPRSSNQSFVTGRRVSLPLLSSATGNLSLPPLFHPSIPTLAPRHPTSGPGGPG